jgi:serine/threonine-protein kinase
VQRRGASGNTTVSRAKALLLHVQREHGRAEADAFLLKAKLDRDYLDDETRPLPIELWHSALEAFASRWGRDEIQRTVPSIVDPENMGVWTRVLRGASEPGEAFKQLEHYGGNEVLTERWHTVAAEPQLWRGRVPLRYDPAFERDGLFNLARATELSAIPVLFGLPPGDVRQLSTEPDRSGGGVQLFEVRWRLPRRGSIAIGGGIGLLGSLGASVALGLPLSSAIEFAGLAAAVGLGSGFVVTQERRRRTQSRSQLRRIQALERSAALRDARERGAAGFREGVVIAGQYRLGEKLGVGASGTIWEATRLADGETVAIKLLRTAVAHDTVAADRLRREAAALGLAWHPNVVEVYDDGHLPDGTSYLVMERLYGESLASRLKRAGALTPAELTPLALQVCDALGAVHAAGVVHRDLKPGNIFLADPDNEGSTPIVKLLDFGIARVEWAETRLTNMGAPVGTPGYMSPEQEQGVEIDSRSDLFALGGVLYECLSGQPPPVRTSELWVAAARAPEGQSESGVQRALRTIPSRWRELIECAMAPLPRDRFPDARSAREAISSLHESADSSERHPIISNS